MWEGNGGLSEDQAGITFVTLLSACLFMLTSGLVENRTHFLLLNPLELNVDLARNPTQQCDKDAHAGQQADNSHHSFGTFAF